MISTVLVVLLSAAAPVKLALPGLNGVNLATGEADLYAEVLAQKFAARNIEVLTARDVQSLLGLERQKQLLGCAEESCLVEMVGALGVDGVVVGDVGKVAGGYAVNVKVLSTKSSKPIALYNGQAATGEQLRTLLDQATWDVSSQLAVSLGRTELKPEGPRPELTVASTGYSPKWRAAIPGAIAVAAGVTGGVLLGLASSKYDQLDHATSVDEAASLRDSGKSLQLGSTIAFAVAGAAAVAAVVVLLFFSSEPKVTPTVFISPNGSSFGLTGVFP